MSKCSEQDTIISMVNNHTLSLPKTYSCVRVLHEHRLELAAVELGHLVGAIKYKPFSWYNSPETSDSTVHNNADAIYRHMTSIEAGYPYDTESHLPHVVHMACRSAMLLCTAVKCVNPLVPGKISVTLPNKNYRFGTLLTGYELMTLAGRNTRITTNYPNHFRYIQNTLPLIVDYADRINTSERKDKELLAEAERLFVHALLACKDWIIKHPYSIDTNNLREKSPIISEYIDTYFTAEKIEEYK